MLESLFRTRCLTCPKAIDRHFLQILLSLTLFTMTEQEGEGWGGMSILQQEHYYYY